MKNNIFNSKKQRLGFTLIELLITIAIIGILSSFLLANFVGVRQRARDGVRKSDLRQVQAALELYRSDQGRYPDAISLSNCDVPLRDSSNTVTYMQKIPCDPSSTALVKTPYSYSTTAGATYTVTACLENPNDSQKDVADTCGGAGAPVSYSLQNP
jgi:general secretion pathway protein G